MNAITSLPQRPRSVQWESVPKVFESLLQFLSIPATYLPPLALTDMPIAPQKHLRTGFSRELSVCLHIEKVYCTL